MATVKNLQITYSDAMKMPTYQRRFMLLKNKEYYEREEEELDNRISKKKGKNSISGDALKNKLRNNEIPNQ